ncbi:MAG: hypothetical protein H0T90_02865 [Gemmatimonadales bacterium]|nr:hypothetical protein [Gemmatimonadales bacterium]
MDDDRLDDDRLDDLVRDAARQYNAPPETPKEEMWARVRAGRLSGARRRKGRRVVAPRYWVPWAAAAAAVLAAGIGLGRLSVGPEAPLPVVAERAAPQVNPTAYRLATLEHLGQSEAFLTLFRTSVVAGGNERLASATARQLLATNRLLLDSPAGEDRRARLLLQDLELILAEIAQLSLESREQDLQLIRDGIERGQMMPRLRTAVPAGPNSMQGAL